MPATIDLAGAEIELVSMVAREGRLRNALAGLQKHDFDYVFIDCPPSLGLLTINALVAAPEVLIPIQCEYYALEGVGQLLRNIEMVKSHLNPNLDVTTVILTMYDGRTKLADQVAEDVRAHFGDKVLRTVIPRSVKVSEAPGYGMTILDYDPGSRGAMSYLDASRELANARTPSIARTADEREGAATDRPGDLARRGDRTDDEASRQAQRTRPRTRIVDPHRARRGEPGEIGPRMGDAAADVVLGGGLARNEPSWRTSARCTGRSTRRPSNPTRGSRGRCSTASALAELVHSIREFGLMQPIVVRAVDRPARRRYQLVMGERRWRAAQEAGLATIPAIVRETADDSMLRDALLENIHRAQLNPLEEAAAYQQLLDEFGVTHDELAVRIGRSRPVITNMIRLMRLPDRGAASGGGRRAVRGPRARPAGARGRAGEAGGTGRPHRRRGAVGPRDGGGGHAGQPGGSRLRAYRAAAQADPDAGPPGRC